MILVHYTQQNVLEKIKLNQYNMLIAILFPRHPIIYNYRLQSRIYDTIKVAITTNGS